MGLLGNSLGRLALPDDDLDTGLEALGAFGARAELLAPAEVAGFGMALEADGFVTRLRSDRIAGLAVADAEVTRLRLLLEVGMRHATIRHDDELCQNARRSLQSDERAYL